LPIRTQTPVGADDPHRWRILAEHPHRGEQVGERPEHLFPFPGGFLDDLGIKPDPGHLHERRTIGKKQVDLADVAGVDDRHRPGQVSAADPKLARKHVHRPRRQHPERGGAPRKPANDRVQRPVTAGGHHHPLALVGKLPRQVARLLDARGRIQGEARRVLHDERQRPPAPLAARARVENQRISRSRLHPPSSSGSPRRGN
jgi:hypothetical protein